MKNICCCKNENEEQDGNYILAEIEIEKDDIYVEQRIINSYEESKRKKIWKDEKEKNDPKYKNEKEIKRYCTIKINDKKIDFNYFYKFKTKGKYILKYSFKKNIKNVAYMFYECRFLTNIDLSNFNTENVTNMSHMFSGCKYLTNIDLSILILKMLLI